VLLLELVDEDEVVLDELLVVVVPPPTPLQLHSFQTPSSSQVWVPDSPPGQAHSSWRPGSQSPPPQPHNNAPDATQPKATTPMTVLIPSSFRDVRSPGLRLWRRKASPGV
jgi:hypothetical protein